MALHLRRSPPGAGFPPPSRSARRLLPMAAGPKMRVLLVLSSTQPDVFGHRPGLLRVDGPVSERVDFEIVIDDLDRQATATWSPASGRSTGSRSMSARR